MSTDAARAWNPFFPPFHCLPETGWHPLVLAGSGLRRMCSRFNHLSEWPAGSRSGGLWSESCGRPKGASQWFHSGLVITSCGQNNKHTSMTVWFCIKSCSYKSSLLLSLWEASYKGQAVKMCAITSNVTTQAPWQRGCVAENGQKDGKNVRAVTPFRALTDESDEK